MVRRAARRAGRCCRMALRGGGARPAGAARRRGGAGGLPRAQRDPRRPRRPRARLPGRGLRPRRLSGRARARDAPVLPADAAAAADPARALDAAGRGRRARLRRPRDDHPRRAAGGAAGRAGHPDRAVRLPGDLPRPHPAGRRPVSGPARGRHAVPADRGAGRDRAGLAPLRDGGRQPPAHRLPAGGRCLALPDRDRLAAAAELEPRLRLDRRADALGRGGDRRAGRGRGAGGVGDAGRGGLAGGDRQPAPERLSPPRLALDQRRARRADRSGRRGRRRPAHLVARSAAPGPRPDRAGRARARRRPGGDRAGVPGAGRRAAPPPPAGGDGLGCRAPGARRLPAGLEGQVLPGARPRRPRRRRA